MLKKNSWTIFNYRRDTLSKTILEYVVSAPAQGFFPLNKNLSEQHLDGIRDGLNACVEIVNQNITKKCNNYTPKFSCLFNAYTEEKMLPMFKRFNNLGFKTFYADSGGLQIVTAGREITEEIKNSIYNVQTVADYAMCFDVIPLTKKVELDEKGEIKTSRNERSNNSNKIYHTQDLLKSGLATGHNIKKQIETFRALKAKTKVIIIVQGNNYKDMILFFNQIDSVLSEEDYEYVGGLAIADTCIGNGESESIEMIRAAKKISEICHKNVRNHLHVLGVGSIKRMAPFVYLKRSGYLDNFQRISYDSSSHTSTFTYGLLKVNGGCKPIGTNRHPRGLMHFKLLYEMFEPYLKQYVSKNKFIEIVYGVEKHTFGKPQIWSHSDIKQRAMDSGDHDHIVIGHLLKALHTCYQIDNFIVNLNKLWVDEYINDGSLPINQLLSVTNEKDMDKWLKLNSTNTKIKSRRIKKSEAVSTLEGFM